MEVLESSTAQSMSSYRSPLLSADDWPKGLNPKDLGGPKGLTVAEDASPSKSDRPSSAKRREVSPGSRLRGPSPWHP